MMHRSVSSRYRRSLHSDRRHKLVRYISVSVIFIGLLVSLFFMLRQPDLYVTIEEMIKAGKFGKVEKVTARLVKSNPLDVRTLILRGRNYFYQAVRADHESKDQTEEGWKLFREAVTTLKKAILLDKKGVITSLDYYIIGYSYMKKGDNAFKEALRYLVLADRRNSRDKVMSESRNELFHVATLHRLTGYLFYKTGDYKEAVKYYQKANKVRRELLNYLYLGYCFRQTGDYNAARKNFWKVFRYTKKDSLKAEALRNLAWVHFKEDNFSMSRQLFQYCLSMDTNYAEGYYWLGKIAERQKDPVSAKSNWKECLRVDPHFGPAILKMKYYRKKK